MLAGNLSLLTPNSKSATADSLPFSSCLQRQKDKGHNDLYQVRAAAHFLGVLF